MFGWAVDELESMLDSEPNHTRAAALFTAIRVLKTAYEDTVKPVDDRPIQGWDRIRILKDGAECATVRRGDVLRVKHVYPSGDICTEGGLLFSESSSYERVND